MALSDRLRPNSEAAPWVIDEVKQMEARVAELKAALDNRAGRLLLKGVPFFVVKASEPYAEQVVNLIREHEGENWTDEDEAWARAALDKREDKK